MALALALAPNTICRMIGADSSVTSTAIRSASTAATPPLGPESTDSGALAVSAPGSIQARVVVAAGAADRAGVADPEAAGAAGAVTSEPRS